MRLKYYILWLEDTESYVTSLKPRLNEFIDDFGFEPEFQIIDGGTNLEDLIDSQTFDFILLDFNLDDDDKNGNDVMDIIRKKNVYTETLFYSSQKGFREHVSSHLDGVFFADKDETDDVFQKAKSVIHLTIRKTQEINNMRGLVIAETLEIEAKMDNLLLSYFGLNDEKNTVFNKILDPSFHALTLKKKWDIVNKICNERINSLRKKYDSLSPEQDDDRKELESRIKLLNELTSEIKKIDKEIIRVRNILAHTKEDPEKKNTLISKIFKNSDPIIIDDDWCRSTRSNIKNHFENLDSLFAHIIETE